MTSRDNPLDAADVSLADLLGRRIQYLVPSHLSRLDELLTTEHASIMTARRWALTNKRRDVLTVAFILELHRKMFEGVWRWAGQLRRSEDVDGARWPTIGIELNDVVREARFWRERKLYSADDLALRIHHRLMRIRAWEGGNGTHARLTADAIAVSLERPPFSWGPRNVSVTKLGEHYASALRDADAGSIQTLLTFARQSS